VAMIEARTPREKPELLPNPRYVIIGSGAELPRSFSLLNAGGHFASTANYVEAHGRGHRMDPAPLQPPHSDR
jgi:hypothetical protein